MLDLIRMTRGTQPRRKAATRDFNRGDRNNDGQMSRQEWLAKYGSMDGFDEVDLNADGVVDENEFVRMAPTDAERVCAGLTAGALSALVMTPTDNIMITQQKHGGSIVGTTNRIRSAFGNIGLYRGLTLCAIRESTGTCCYIAAFPMMRREISNRYPETPAAVCSTVAAVATSSLSCLLNHPADTLKTRIQGSMFPHAAEISQPTISTAYRTVQAECGGTATGMARQLYRGLLPRLFRISCGCMILDSIKSGLEDACCS